MLLAGVAVSAYSIVFAECIGYFSNPYSTAALAWSVSVLTTAAPVYMFIAWRRRIESAYSRVINIDDDTTLVTNTTLPKFASPVTGVYVNKYFMDGDEELLTADEPF